MLLLCGGKSRVDNQDHDGKPIPIYPSVIAVIDEDEPDYPVYLRNLMSSVVEPFVVRLLDKDFVKIVNCRVGQKALKEQD